MKAGGSFHAGSFCFTLFDVPFSVVTGKLPVNSGMQKIPTTENLSQTFLVRSLQKIFGYGEADPSDPQVSEMSIETFDTYFKVLKLEPAEG